MTNVELVNLIDEIEDESKKAHLIICNLLELCDCPTGSEPDIKYVKGEMSHKAHLRTFNFVNNFSDIETLSRILLDYIFKITQLSKI